jgi:hypothetical protein
MRRTFELVQEIHYRATAANHLLAEYAATTAQQGAGIHRDPEMVLSDLRAELNDLWRAAMEAREAEEDR